MSQSQGLIFITTTDPFLNFVRLVTGCSFDLVGFYFSSNLSGLIETHLYLYNILTGVCPSWGAPPCNLDRVKDYPFISRIVIRPLKESSISKDFKAKFINLKMKENQEEHLDRLLFYLIRREVQNHPFIYYYDFLERLGSEPWTNYFGFPQNILIGHQPDDAWIIGENYQGLIVKLVNRCFHLFINNSGFRLGFLAMFQSVYQHFKPDLSTKASIITQTVKFLEEMILTGTVAPERLIDNFKGLQSLIDEKDQKSPLALMSYNLAQFPLSIRYNFFIRLPFPAKEINTFQIKPDEKKVETKQIEHLKETHLEDVRLLHQQLRKLGKNIEKCEPGIINLNMLIRLANSLGAPLNLDPIEELKPLSLTLLGYTTEYPSIKLKTNEGSQIILSTADPDLTEIPLKTLKEIGILLEGKDFRFDYLRAKVADKIAQENFRVPTEF